MTTRKKISAEIFRRTGLKIEIANGGGYFYFFSNDPDMALIIATWPETSVYVYRLNDLTVSDWADCFDKFWKGVN